MSIQHNLRVSFCVMLLIQKGAVALLMFINKFVLVSCLSFLFRYVIELRLLQKLKYVKQPGLRYEKFHNLMEFLG